MKQEKPRENMQKKLTQKFPNNQTCRNKKYQKY